MTNFDIHTVTTAPEHAQPMLEKVAENIGFVPNIFAVTAASPSALSGLLEINNAFAASSFTPEEQQIILMATSIANGCVYCVAGHSLMARNTGIAEADINAMRDQQRVDDPGHAILQRMVSELIQYRGRVDDPTLAEFLLQGYSKAQFFELVLGVSVKTFTNYVSNALSLTLDDAFKPYRWDRPDESRKTA